MIFIAMIEKTIPTRDRAGLHWSSLEERGVYLGLKLMLMTFRILGRPGFSLLLYPVILYFFLANGTARRASADYLTRINSDMAGHKMLGRWPAQLRTFRHFMCFGEAILDKFRAWTGKLQLKDISFENQEMLDALRNSGQGGVLIASHLGNVEVGRALATHKLNLKITALVHTKHAKKFNKLMQEESADSTLSIIQTTEIGPDTAMLLKQKVDDGGFVVIVGDRTPVGGSLRVIWAPFLGRPAPFPEGPFVLAAILKCPVLLIFCLKQNDRFRVIYEPFCDVIDMPRARRREVLSALVVRYAKRLEFHCLSHPYQWFNFFDFWGGVSAIPSDEERSKS